MARPLKRLSSWWRRSRIPPYSPRPSTRSIGRGWRESTSLPWTWDQPDTAVLRRGYNEIGHASYIPFRAPLPTGYPRAYYLLVTDSGVSPIQVSELRGEVGYDVDPPTYRLSGRRVAYGNAAFHRPARVRGKEEFIVWSTS